MYLWPKTRIAFDLDAAQIELERLVTGQKSFLIPQHGFDFSIAHQFGHVAVCEQQVVALGKTRLQRRFHFKLS